MKKALFSQLSEKGQLKCLLCPHLCTPAEGKAGKCGVRRNAEGTLVAETYGRVSALHYDPIEKKPLYHFYPGNIILSIGSVGCNLSCSFCQNCDISNAGVRDYPWISNYTVEEIVNMASDHPENLGIAFTYNEPSISYEYVLEISRLASSWGLRTAMISNGFINPEPLARLLPLMDAFNIDLKAFRDEFYIETTRSRLAPVLETLKTLKQSGKHFEITNLVIPGLNDEVEVFTEMIDWIASELGRYTVLHLSRYFPRHKMDRKATPENTLLNLYDIARQKLTFVYIGNIASEVGKDTLCPECHEILISRSGYRSAIKSLNKDADCMKCGTHIENLVL